MEISVLLDNKTDEDFFSGNFFEDISKILFDNVKAENDFLEISLLILDDAKIREINRLYRGIDKPTDVLSFPMNPEESVAKYMIGDVVISADKAKKQAKDAGISFERELAYLYIHGLLHLLGYDHEISEAEEKVMFDLQENILTQVIEAGICS
ncbi:MAG: rRNA maturation RNase YbeY [Flexistipes sinusarabici]|uniref:Endoribonuclease YbeY n=1 Tax=Flexistipes sinusarabici TaxID=2352 RepID=A0A5D0MG01_FLESI|nr:rRNA maturation RNase YbeY [Flexistipes sinusarabici]TYB32607.1 MAG: rRNA maturation RNase YbeY [Flexistipes sinusarabici]